MRLAAASGEQMGCSAGAWAAAAVGAEGCCSSWRGGLLQQLAPRAAIGGHPCGEVLCLAFLAQHNLGCGRHTAGLVSVGPGVVGLFKQYVVCR